jgi:hypothetical protein
LRYYGIQPSYAVIIQGDRMNRKALLGATLLAPLAMPAIASAQDFDRDRDDREHRLTGRVISFRPWNLQLDNGPHIFLHPGTVIRPTGMTPENGMFVRVIGHRTRDDNFAADEIVLLPGPPRAFRRNF